MNDYSVNYTDTSLDPIQIPETETAKAGSAITLFGRINPEYGQLLDQDLLNLIENFSCPEAPGNTDFMLAVPYLADTSDNQLADPVVGQFWYNSTRQSPYYWTGTSWNPLALRENLAANWGQILNGEQLPKPISPLTGQPIDYKDCIWSVSPTVFTGKVGFMACAADNNAVVTMKYRLSGSNTMLSGYANYLIIGIRGNYNTGENKPVIEVTPTPSVTMTMTPSATTTPTPTPSITATMTVTPTLSVTPSPTPQPSYSPTPAVSSTPAPTPAVSSTPAPSPNPRPYWVLTNERCQHYPNYEVIYGCPEEPNNYYCQSAADIGRTETTTSDCYSGNGMTRCVRQYRCQLP